jgi:hypothetical protein
VKLAGDPLAGRFRIDTGWTGVASTDAVGKDLSGATPLPTACAEFGVDDSP